MATETLFLDAGGVLVFPNWQRVKETLARHGVAVDVARMAEAEPRVRRELDTSEGVRTTTDTTRGEAYWRRIFALSGVSYGSETAGAREELEEYHATHNLWESVPTDTAPSLARLRKLDLRMAVMSNSNGTLRKKLERLGLLSFFDLVVDSTEERVEKPNPRIFQLGLERLGAAAATTLHVGDLYHVDVVGARAAGVEGALLDPLGLYEGVDCRRFSSLSSLAGALETSA